MVEALAPLVHEREGLLSVHLMIERPETYLQRFVRAGADALSVHVEACPHLYHAIQAIKSLGAGAGVALNPGTDLARVAEVAALVDFVLVMTVNPGFGGQHLIAPALAKVPRCVDSCPSVSAIEVDGGIDAENMKRVVEAGANWIVAGSAVFGAGDPAETRAACRS